MSSESEAADRTRKELEAFSAAWEQAMVANNAEAIGHFMADGWVIVSETGVTKRAEFLAVIASGDLTHEAFTGDVISVRQYGDTAIVMARVKNNGAYKASRLALTNGRLMYSSRVMASGDVSIAT